MRRIRIRRGETKAVAISEESLQNFITQAKMGLSAHAEFLKNIMERHYVSWEDFRKEVNTLYKDIDEGLAYELNKLRNWRPRFDPPQSDLYAERLKYKDMVDTLNRKAWGLEEEKEWDYDRAG